MRRSDVPSMRSRERALRRFAAVVAVALAVAASPGRADEFDLVIESGRVLDAETGLDGIRNLGIRDGRIAVISEEPIAGEERIDATGLVVVPGFIDLHQHAWDEETYRFKIRDGVTAILELEVGTDDVDAWYAEREGRLPLHYGVAVGHIPVRMRVMGDFPSFLPKSDSKAATVVASEEQVDEMERGIARGLEAGAVAVGFGISYTPAATPAEVLAMFRVAGGHGAPCHVHLRGRGDESLAAVGEALEAAEASGAPVQLVHLQASGARQTPEILRLVEQAREKGVKVSVEVYPWTAGMTDIRSSIFAEGWRASFRLGYGDLQWGETGERLTEETFRKYRETGGLVIVHSNTEEIVTLAVTHPASLIASDGLVGHPRNAGTYARILGHYTRDRGELDWMDAVRKCSLMPAQWLEKRVPAMRRKGRIQAGCDADLVLFDPESVGEQATFTEAKRPSRGIPHVLVGGTAVVRDGEVVEAALPGRAIRAPRGGEN